MAGNSAGLHDQAADAHMKARDAHMAVGAGATASEHMKMAKAHEAKADEIRRDEQGRFAPK